MDDWELTLYIAGQLYGVKIYVNDHMNTMAITGYFGISSVIIVTAMVNNIYRVGVISHTIRTSKQTAKF